MFTFLLPTYYIDFCVMHIHFTFYMKVHSEHQDSRLKTIKNFHKKHN